MAGIPYQELTSQAWQAYLAQLATTQMQQPVGAAITSAIASQIDYAADRVRMALKAKMPGLAPPDALTQIGLERGMPQGQSEANAAYSARLLDAWNAWPWAGTAFGLLRAFYATGYTNVVLAQPNGGKLFTLDNGGTNLLTWSADLSNAAWSLTTATIAKNSAAAPDGTTTAALLTATANAGFISQQGIASASAVQYTASGYLGLSGGAHSAEVLIWDSTAGSAIATTGLVALPASGFTRFSVSGLGVAGHALQIRIYPAGNQAATGACLVAYPQFEAATAASAYCQTYANAKPTTAGAGALLTTTESNGIWETAPLLVGTSWGGFSWGAVNYVVTANVGITSNPYLNRQFFWSAFDVIFPLPINPASFSWAALGPSWNSFTWGNASFDNLPSSTSAESNFVRALIAAWKPAHATCNRITIVRQGLVFGYPAGNTPAGQGLAWNSFDWGRTAVWNYPLTPTWASFAWGSAYYASPMQLGLTWGSASQSWGNSSTTNWTP